MILSTGQSFPVGFYVAANRQLFNDVNNFNCTGNGGLLTRNWFKLLAEYLVDCDTCKPFWNDKCSEITKRLWCPRLNSGLIVSKIDHCIEITSGRILNYGTSPFILPPILC